MTKKNLLKTLDYASYVSVVLGAVLVLFFEIFASLVVMKIAIIAFGASFLMLVILSAMKLYFMNNEIKENEELLVDKTKEKKPWLIVKLVLASLMFALMIVFLCIY